MSGPLAFFEPGELRQALEQQGISVRGGDVARVVGAALGKAIEWTG